MNQLSDKRLFRGTSIVRLCNILKFLVIQFEQHWHGIHMHHNNEYDGAVSVSQCPLVSTSGYILVPFTYGNTVL